MDAILLAGGVPEPDSPLYPYTQGKPKAALQIGEKLMVQWVLDALEASPSITGIILIGSQDLNSRLSSSKILESLPAGNDLIMNFQHGAEALLSHNPTAEKVSVVSSDIPLLTAEAVEWVIASVKSSDRDVHYCVIDQHRMEKRFPESARSYVKLRDRSVCGGDLSVINLDLYKSRPDFWRKVFAARKSYLRQASLVGFDILFLLLLRRLTLEQTVHKVTRRLGITGTALDCPYPEIGMDIDKPHQLEIARKELS